MDRISDDELNTLINHYYHQDKTKSALTELRERRAAEKVTENICEICGSLPSCRCGHGA